MIFKFLIGSLRRYSSTLVAYVHMEEFDPIMYNINHTMFLYLLVSRTSRIRHSRRYG